MLTRFATTATRVVAHQRPRPLAHLLRSGSSQTVRSTTALIDPAVLTRDQAKPPVLSTDKIDALLHGDTEIEHGRYASVASTRAQTLPKPEFTEVEAADHAWRQTNHIWSNDELDKVSIEKHEPVTVSDHFMKGVMNVLYHGFNFVTGYDPVDPSPPVWKSTSVSGKSFLGDDAAVLARSSGEEFTSPRRRAGVASMAWRTTRRSSTNAP